MDFEKQAPDEIVEDADVALEGEIPDDAAEAVAGGITTIERYKSLLKERYKSRQASFPEVHTGVRVGTDGNR